MQSDSSLIVYLLVVKGDILHMSFVITNKYKMKKLINLVLSLIRKKPKSEPVKELVAKVTERMGEFVEKGTATINIDGYNYFIQTPFQKEGQAPLNNTQESVHRYLSSLHLIQPLDKELIYWLKNDMKMKDAPVSEYGLCYFLRDFRAEDHNSIVHLATIHNDNMLMIMAIEHNGSEIKERGLNHMTCLIKTVSAIEDKHFGGYALLSPFKLMENPEMVSKHLRKGNKSIYCFLVKY